MADSSDYVIVGAGSAGCVLAARLTEQEDCGVVVLEAGGNDSRWQVRIPAAVRENVKATSRCNWHYQSEPEPWLDDRRLDHPRGKVLGGSGSINGMVFLRGHRQDFDRWSQEGAEGWSYRSVLPYFKRLESREDGADDYRGAHGPVRVRKQHDLLALARAFLDAGTSLGYPFTEDVNGAQQEGFCRFDMNIDNGTRASSAYACLRPAMNRPNLEVRTLCQVRRILFEGSRATGVEYRQHGEVRRVFARREVVLCAGAIGTPQLLMISGVGPADHLREHGIGVVADVPGVGCNLQDHLEIHLQHECPDPVSLNIHLHPVRKLAVGLRWFLNRSGPAAVNQSHVGAFLSLHAESAHPDTEIHFWPVFFHGWEVPHDRFGFRLGVGPLRPTSRGELRLAASDPARHPRLRFNYCATLEDRLAMRECVKLARAVASQPAFEPFRSREVDPGPSVRTDAEIEAWVRATATTSWHPIGTCAMGNAESPRTVVDPHTRVKGVAGLRVVDASIMPSMVSSNPNAVVMMMAERASDLIKGTTTLAPIDPPDDPLPA